MALIVVGHWDPFRRRLHPSRTTLRMRSRSANLWFGRLLEGDDYRWWEVSYLYGSDSSDGEPEPFGHCKRFVTYGSRLACDPWPITPEHVDGFFDRWIELFAQVATSDDRTIALLLPGTFKRQPVAPAFREVGPPLDRGPTFGPFRVFHRCLQSR
jgi:hypothetical protein